MSSIWYLEETCPRCGAEHYRLIAKTDEKHEPLFRAYPDENIWDFEGIMKEVNRVGSVVRSGYAVISPERFSNLMLSMKAKETRNEADTFRDTSGWLFIKSDFA